MRICACTKPVNRRIYACATRQSRLSDLNRFLETRRRDHDAQVCERPNTVHDRATMRRAKIMTHAPTRRMLIRSIGVIAAASQLPTRLMANSPAHPQGVANMTLTHVTAPTQFIDATGIRFAFRRFGKEGGTPLVLM